MDLLSSYDDEASSTPKLKPKPDQAKIESKMNDASHPSELSSVEKGLESAPVKPVEKSEQSSSMDVDEEDESHLPPGVRKKNRYNNSSSSSSSEDEGEKAKKSNDLTSSDSDSDKSDHKPSKHDSSSSSKHGFKHESKRHSRDRDGSGKGRHSRSRSRSKSRSASPRKRRRSSDRSRHSRSRSRDRRHKKERRRRSHRSRSRSRDRRRSRDRHRRKRDRRRSRSRSRDRRDRHRDRRRRSRSRSRGRRSRSRSGDRRRDRSHSRSPSPVGKVIKFGDKVIKPGASFGRPSNFSKPLTFKEKMRQQFIKAMEDGTNSTDPLTTKDGVALCTQSAGIHQQPPQPKKPPVPLMATLVTSTASLASMTVTASEAAMQSMLALQKEATEKTGVEIPKYYNPAAINPMKYAEQVQKRKLLWSKSKEKDVKSQWHATSLSGDHDDKSKEKFRKLMGIKEDGATEEEVDPAGEEQEDKQRQLFDQLHKEYQFARMATHTHRGIGLGFGASAFPEQPPS